MSEIKALLAKAEKYLLSADLLLKAGDYDSSVSRSYYAMLYATHSLLLTKNLAISSHKGSITIFGKHFVKSGVFSREMSKKLTRAFEKRQIGDYQHTVVITEAEAGEMLNDGRVFLAESVDYLKRTGFLGDE